MKPIFEKERLFLQKYGIDIPQECWREGSKIYLNADYETLIIQFKVEHQNIIVKKNKLNEVIKIHKKKSFNDEILENNARLNNLEKVSIDKTVECINRYKDSEFRVSDSGGKDSLVCMNIFQKALEKADIKHDYEVDFFNTSNDTGDTYRQIKSNIKNVCKHQLRHKLNREPSAEEVESMYNAKLYTWVHNPELGWYQWLAEVKKYYLPSVMVRNCCSTYKEGKLKNILDKKHEYVLFLGMRKYESSKRASYDYYLNEAMDKMYEETKQNKYKLNVPRNWVRFLPIVEWEDKDIWLYILREKLKFNPMYLKGFNRVGCLLCPYSTDYNDLLIKEFYPLQYNRWCNIVEKNYDLYNVENRLKWTKQEYIQEGKWKSSTSKEHEIIFKKPTKERVKELAQLKGCSEEIAQKYFKQTCSCGKKLNVDEIAMYLKLYGRYENKEDNRVYLCKTCVCNDLNMSKDEYADKIKEFRNSGCNLF